MVVCLFSATAYAAQINVQGSATGSFADTYGGRLGYTAANFNVTTGLAGNFSNISLGTVAFNAGPCIFGCGYGTDFTSTITISVPSGSTPAPSQQTATVNGWALWGGGQLALTFATPSVNFTYLNGQGSGGFTLTLQNLTVTDSGSGSGQGTLLGSITNATFSPTPEPGSVGLLLSVLVGVGYTLRKRFSAA